MSRLHEGWAGGRSGQWLALLACSLAFAVCGTARAAEPEICVRGPGGELCLESNGISLHPFVPACPAIVPRGGTLWTVLLQKKSIPAFQDVEATEETLRRQRHPEVRQFVADDVTVLTDHAQRVIRETLPEGFRLRYRTLGDGQRVWDVSLTLEFRRKGRGFEVTGSLTNREPGWVVCGFDGPALEGIRVDLADCPALLADGFGRRINRTPLGTEEVPPKPWRLDGKVYEASAWYPSQGGSMPWCALAGRGGGLYLGCHDAAHGSKVLCLRYDPENHRFGLLIRHQFFCIPGASWPLPPTVIEPYEGSWHAASRIYRSWRDAAAPLGEPPGWTRDVSGWLLAILKQQNGEVLWDYPSVEKMCAVADQRGLDMLGLFGWAQGGHDTLYPDYVPDPAMGGRDGLVRALAMARQRGKRVILYANGQLQERGTDFWKEQGRALAVLQKDGSSMQERWRKFQDAPAHSFDLACPGTADWYDRMLALALQANELGADGILYDQLGVRAPMACYARGHGHPVPSMVYAGDRADLLRRIAAHMKTLNPEFAVMTEGIHDSLLDSVSLFWANTQDLRTMSSAEMALRLDPGAVSAWFPEMFRYTFPEVMSTVRVPRPVIDRAMINYACVYGFRFEIESRYAPDVRYLLEGRTAEAVDYDRVVEKPDLTHLLTTPPEEAAGYLKQVAEFQRSHAEVLRHGRFTDEDGFAFQGEGLVAKGYRNGATLGVMVWNPAEVPAPFTLRVPGAVRVSVSEPGREEVDPFSPLGSQSVRLFVWRKR